MYQYYIVEIQTFANGTFAYLVHTASDENADQARLKAESKFHQVLSAAAISELPRHAAIMFTSEGFPVMNQCYKHPVQPQSEPVVEETLAEPENEGGSNLFG